MRHMPPDMEPDWSAHFLYGVCLSYSSYGEAFSPNGIHMLELSLIYPYTLLILHIYQGKKTCNFPKLQIGSWSSHIFNCLTFYYTCHFWDDVAPVTSRDEFIVPTLDSIMTNKYFQVGNFWHLCTNLWGSEGNESMNALSRIEYHTPDREHSSKCSWGALRWLAYHHIFKYIYIYMHIHIYIYIYVCLSFTYKSLSPRYPLPIILPL